MSDELILKVLFFQTEAGREPVREWLKSLDQNDRKTIGDDVKLVQFRWPLGMPLVRKMENDLWEVRTRLGNRRMARIHFTIRGNEMALLHGFIKKSQKTPANELSLARTRRDQWQREWGSDE
jgi:phage-related protein